MARMIISNSMEMFRKSLPTSLAASAPGLIAIDLGSITNKMNAFFNVV